MVPSCEPVTFLPTQVMLLFYASIFLVCAEATVVAVKAKNASAIVLKFFMCNLVIKLKCNK